MALERKQDEVEQVNLKEGKGSGKFWFLKFKVYAKNFIGGTFDLLLQTFPHLSILPNFGSNS